MKIAKKFLKSPMATYNKMLISNKNIKDKGLNKTRLTKILSNQKQIKRKIIQQKLIIEL